MDFLGSWPDKRLYFCFEEVTPSLEHSLVIYTSPLSQILFCNQLRFDGVDVDVPTRFRLDREEAMRVPPVMKLETFAHRANTPPSPGSCMFGSKIVFIGQEQSLEIETDEDLDPNPQLVPSTLVSPFQLENPFPILLRLKAIDNMVALATVEEGAIFFQNLDLPANGQAWIGINAAPFPNDEDPNEYVGFDGLACAVLDWKILMSATHAGVYVCDLRVPGLDWVSLSDELGMEELPWDKRALALSLNHDFLIVGYTAAEPWSISVYHMSFECDQWSRTAVDGCPFVPLGCLEPSPTDWAFTPIQDKIFSLTLTVQVADSVRLVVVIFEAICDDEVVDLQLLGRKTYVIHRADRNLNLIGVHLS